LDYPAALWAALKLGAVPSCANPSFTSSELVHQLKLSKSKYILTHPLFLKATMEAANQVGIPESNIFLIAKDNSSKLPNVPNLVELGKSSPEIIPLKLKPGESKTKVALLNFSSGTSGLPKGVLITHYNVIANVCQMWSPEAGNTVEGAISNGCLPFYHSTTP
jgi:4-coumarate--CoA ligase